MVRTVVNIQLYNAPFCPLAMKLFTDVAAGISIVWCKHQKFFQSMTATASVHIAANLCKNKVCVHFKFLEIMSCDDIKILIFRFSLLNQVPLFEAKIILGTRTHAFLVLCQITVHPSVLCTPLPHEDTIMCSPASDTLLGYC